MTLITRSSENPVIVPESHVSWESDGAFNGSAVYARGAFRLVYRAQSKPLYHQTGDWISLSSIGYATSTDGVHFRDRKLFISPEEQWERYGCEDPRITRLGDTFYIFYTALSHFPFGPEGIKVAVALTKDFHRVTERHLVTPFNAKAMALFPEKIGGKLAALLTVDTDRPPARIALATFETPEDLWNEDRWNEWYEHVEEQEISLLRRNEDHVELGAPPIWTKDGWVIFYSYIRNYHTPRPVFTIEAALLDLKDPRKIIGRTVAPLLTPEESYEQYGKVKDIVFPSGAVVRGKKYYLYYGGADTTTCLATGDLAALLTELKTKPEK